MAYEFIEDEPENLAATIGKEGLRHGARTASNIATRAVGLPGDIFSLVNQFVAKPVSKFITGEEGVPYEKTLLGKVLPTTETHRKGLEPVTGEYLKPQNDIERFADDVIEDTALLFEPTKLIRKGIKLGEKAITPTKRLYKSFAKSLGANLAGETVKQFGAGEAAGAFTKLGSLFVLSLLDQEAAAKQIGKLYGEAETNLPSTAKTSAKTLEKKINALEKGITKERPIENLSPPEKFVINQTDKVKNLIKNGEINIPQAVAQKRSLYKELDTLYKEVPRGKEQKNVKDLAKQIGSFLNETISEYGKTNPKFFKPYKNADEAFGTLAKSNFISHWIDSNIAHNPVTVGLLHLFGGPIGTTAATAAVPYQAAKLTYRIAKSPTLAKIYGKTVSAAVKEDSKAFNKYIKELDDELQKDEAEDRYEFLDQ